MIRSDLLRVAGPQSALTSPGPLTALQRALADQQNLTAVERFSQCHSANTVGDTGIYKQLIPLTSPGPGQQYAFQVDLDLCTGCKACVTGCHNLNGLDETEIWRTVGLLHGGTVAAPTQQTVTTACHHCVDPACMNGCPVKAYEKDPVTGIVKHLDDQCIGCQYCTFMCPYDAPKYSPARGIVRKCDMCSDRLTHGEAPACVQSCPNEAIRITVVDKEEVVQTSQANAFLPGAPTPADTLPTTVYKTSRVLPRNLLPADFYSVSPEHAHPPLVAMLTLTQLSVGAFVLNQLVGRLLGTLANPLALVNALFALALGLAALGASTFHLGRPQFAFRAFLGLRTSWLSREILTFSGFAGLAAASAAATLLGRPIPILAPAAAAFGLLGVFCSVMVYTATKRAHWRGSITGFKFFTTAAILGAATVLAVSTAASLGTRSANLTPLLQTGTLRDLFLLLLLASGVKLAFELSVFRHLRDVQHSVGKRQAILMTHALKLLTQARFAASVLGGVILPAAGFHLAGETPVPGTNLAVLSLFAAALCLVGELLERTIFFAAAPASKMPGGLN